MPRAKRRQDSASLRMRVLTGSPCRKYDSAFPGRRTHRVPIRRPPLGHLLRRSDHDVLGNRQIGEQTADRDRQGAPVVDLVKYNENVQIAARASVSTRSRSKEDDPGRAESLADPGYHGPDVRFVGGYEASMSIR